MKFVDDDDDDDSSHNGLRKSGVQQPEILCVAGRLTLLHIQDVHVRDCRRN